jgi:hypothetical protein
MIYKTKKSCFVHKILTLKQSIAYVCHFASYTGLMKFGIGL